MTTTGEQVCNAVTEFLVINEVSMDNMISICTDDAPSMIGKKRICVKINWKQKRV